MDIFKMQLITSIGAFLKDLTAEDMNLSKELLEEMQVTKIDNTSLMVRMKTARGPRYFSVKVTERL